MVKCKSIFDVTCTPNKWYVDRISFAFTSTDLADRPCPRIIRILMHGNEEDPWIIIERVLGSIAVMQVPIYDCNPTKIVLCQGISSRYGNIIEQTKPHSPIVFSMVAGRPNQSYTITGRTLHNCIDEV